MKDDRYYLLNMLDYAEKIQALFTTRSRQDFDDDELLRETCKYWLQVIGESARWVSEAFRSQHDNIPWRAMVGMRNRIVHDYLGIDDEIVWETVDKRIPELIQLLSAIVPEDKNLGENSE